MPDLIPCCFIWAGNFQVASKLPASIPPHPIYLQTPPHHPQNNSPKSHTAPQSETHFPDKQCSNSPPRCQTRIQGKQRNPDNPPTAPCRHAQPIGAAFGNALKKQFSLPLDVGKLRHLVLNKIKIHLLNISRFKRHRHRHLQKFPHQENSARGFFAHPFPFAQKYLYHFHLFLPQHKKAT